MTRRIPTHLIGAAALALGVGLGAQAVPAAEWKLTLEEIEGSVQDAFAQEFKQRIEERSGGEITVTVYPYGQLGTSGDLTELTAGGVIEMTHASPGHLGSFIPEVQVFSIPYLLSEDNEVNKRILSESPTIYEDLQQHFEPRDLRLLTMYPEGEMVWTANREVRSPEDLSGFRMRTMVSPMLTEAYSAFGASPTPLPYGEVYGALQLGMIDGQVNPIFAIEEMGFYEVQDYMIWTGEQQFTTTVVANHAWYHGLSDEHRQLLDETIQEVTEWIFDVQEEYNQERLEKIRESKPDMQMIELTPEEREVFRERAQAVREAYVRLAGESGQQILDSLVAEIEEAEEELGVAD
jgi:TRAP-type transport system periplasmic protein